MLSGALCLFWVSGFLESWELYDKSFVFVAGFTSQPLSGWTEQDILEYYLFTGDRYARDVYGDILVNCDGSLYLSGHNVLGVNFVFMVRNVKRER